MRTILVGLAAVALSGCGGSTHHGLRVVASTNVYGDIARQIGGSRLEITSVLSDPNADPHLFEPGTANGLAVAQAAVVIRNGLGYDAFMTKLEDAAPSSHRIDVVIADAVGIHGADANPHLWYDVPALGRVASAIEEALARADPGHVAAYRAGLAQFDSSLAPLRHAVAAIRAHHASAPVAYTEPVPGYLLSAAGLRNLAPSSFTHAIEEGTEPSPGAVAQMLGLMRARRVRVLLYNRQAVSPITARIRTAARAAGIPVIGVTETLPPGSTFQQWQLDQANALAEALAP
jgi:zinc/manganese transport system substrate-binding protein